MIGRLKGVLLEKQPPHLLLDVQGVGYELDVSLSTFDKLPETGSEVILHTHLSVREDAHVLFGFINESERQLFRSLIRINGVGPKLALGILSGISAEELVRCVQDKDVASLTRLPGIGKKTAERLLIELADRIKGWGVIPADAGIGTSHNPPAASMIADALSALASLGYKHQEAEQMVRAINTEGLSSDEIIRLALQQTVKA